MAWCLSYHDAYKHSVKKKSKKINKLSIFGPQTNAHTGVLNHGNKVVEKDAYLDAALTEYTVTTNMPSHIFVHLLQTNRAIFPIVTAVTPIVRIRHNIHPHRRVLFE